MSKKVQRQRLLIDEGPAERAERRPATTDDLHRETGHAERIADDWKRWDRGLGQTIRELAGAIEQDDWQSVEALAGAAQRMTVWVPGGNMSATERALSASLWRVLERLAEDMQEQADSGPLHATEAPAEDGRVIVTREAGGYLATVEGDDLDPGAIADTPGEAVQALLRGPARRFARVEVVEQLGDEDDDQGDDDDGAELEDDEGDVDDDAERFGFVENEAPQLELFEEPESTPQRRLRWRAR